MKLTKVKIADLHPHPLNYNTHPEAQITELMKSLDAFSQFKNIVVSHGVILAGHGLVEAAKRKGLTEVYALIRDDLTDDEQKALLVADNALPFLALPDAAALESLLTGVVMEIPGVNEEWTQAMGLSLNSMTEREESQLSESKTLTERFVVPPFSILDTRQGYWQDRKKAWKEKIQDNGESRENSLGESEKVDGKYKTGCENIAPNVSILDPVLAEIINLWFGLPQCNTFDCFAGDSVFGYVSSFLGNTFTGIELRQEQAALNQSRVDAVSLSAKYICDDGQNVLSHVPANSQDLLFSCPPYFDLEVYSDLPNDASNQKEYDGFLQILNNAFTAAIQCLKENRFAVIVIGDVRDKHGYYLRLPDDIKTIFQKNGMRLYNEIILIEQSGTAAIRAGNAMKNRKVVKTHQNVLVFFKGDNKDIKQTFPKIEYDSTNFSEGI